MYVSDVKTNMENLKTVVIMFRECRVPPFVPDSDYKAYSKGRNVN
jgi:hypothetical protein